MGCFSFTKADWYNTQVANILLDGPFKFLIPAVYGGGFIKGRYDGYGMLADKNGTEYDVFELLAFWNADMRTFQDKKVRDYLKFDGAFPSMKSVDEYTEKNRHVGIDIACYDDHIDALLFPPKFVSASYRGTYEETPHHSYNDPEQGLCAMTWDDFYNRKVAHRRLHIERKDDFI